MHKVIVQNEPPDRFRDDQDSADPDKKALKQPRDAFCLAVSIRMVLVGWLFRFSERKEIDCGDKHIEERIDPGGKDT